MLPQLQSISCATIAEHISQPISVGAANAHCRISACLKGVQLQSISFDATNAAAMSQLTSFGATNAAAMSVCEKGGQLKPISFGATMREGLAIAADLRWRVYLSVRVWWPVVSPDQGPDQAM